MQELGIATLTSCFVNSNRDPKKGEPVKPSDYFYFTPTEGSDIKISAVAANAFFALADAGKLPGWVVAIAPVDKLLKARTSDPIKPLVWIGEGLVLLQPRVEDGVVKFPMGFVDTSGEVETTGGVVRVPELGNVWMIDGEFAVTSPVGAGVGG
ncbi:hypothetical protein [Aulosira sp. FACHB-615]|uniref:hypothetical protein n=1 Tax=Aulosira sp. FACHB-615 TaxID=2692777 RepID=UPI001683D4BD|nr:hypothetical protein [Aulosira sp. FACHB-615]MBD2489011.1 hypothetical protein [Aulosira sp. FACHB-615]